MENTETNTNSNSPFGARGSSSISQTDSWCIIEEGFKSNDQLASELIFNIGNGYISQCGNLEEYYSGETILGSYINGVDSLDKTLLENQKKENANLNSNKVNSPNWTGIIVRLNEEVLDLGTWEVENFKRVLNMRDGILERTFEATSPKGNKIQASVKRFVSLAENEIGAINYTIKSLNFEGRISFMPIIDGEIKENHLDNYESFWNVLQTKTQQEVAHLWHQIRFKDFHVCTALSYVLYKNNEQLKANPTKIEKEKVAGFSVGTEVRTGDTVYINKYVAIISTLNHQRANITQTACSLALAAKQKGWKQLLVEHSAVWAKKWLENKIETNIDIEMEQELRYKAFQSIQNLANKQNVE